MPVAELLAETVAEAEVTARVAGPRRRVHRATCSRPDWPCAPTAAGCTRCWSTCWTTPRGTARPGSAVSVVGPHRGGAAGRSRSRDEGPGIAPEDRERVFHRFTRGERAVGGGTGLGLAIARWAVELHGGRIAVGSTPTRRRRAAGSGSRCRERVVTADHEVPVERDTSGPATMARRSSPPLFGDRWPGRPSRRRALLGAVAAAGLAFAVAVPTGATGVGWLSPWRSCSPPRSPCSGTRATATRPAYPAR